MLGDGVGVARFERSQLGTGGLVELPPRDVLVDLGGPVAVRRDVGPIVTATPVPLTSVRETSAPVVTGTTVLTTAVLTAAVIAVAASAALATVAPRGVTATALVLPIPPRGVTAPAVATVLANPARPPLPLPVLAAALVALAAPAVTSRGVPATAVATGTAVLAAVLIALAVPAVPPRGVTATALVTGTTVLTAALMTPATGPAAVAGGAVASVVGTPARHRTGTVAAAARSSAGPAVAGVLVPALVPGTVLERLGHVPLLCAGVLLAGVRGCRR
ncbi:MAG: hypothetical protein ACOC84_11250 [Actinomycetota bacterium]